MRVLKAVLHPILQHPLVFDVQERLCNNYDAVEREFHDYLIAARDVLDIGCSTGACAASVFDFNRHRYVGIDIDASYVAHAARRYPAGRFLRMDARRLQFAEESFDRVLFMGAMHHMSDDLVRECLREVRRVLRPDGRVLVGEPVFVRDWPLSTLLLRLDRGGFIRSTEGYSGLFDGFEIERERYFSFSLHRFVSYVLRKGD